MARTIDSAFDELVGSLRSSRIEISSAASHRQSIKAKLEQSFGMTAFFRSGSYGNGTNVSGYSDVDYFAVIPAANLHQDSSVSLSRIAAALRERFPTTSNIRVNGPAVQLPFGLDGAQHTEIIPVDARGTTKLGFREFEMPDGTGGWMFSAPESHNAWVVEIDGNFNGRLRRLIRLLKFWRSVRSVPIRSFYLEMYAAAYASSETVIVYEIDIKTVLQKLSAEGLPSIIDPRFPGDGRYLEPCSTAISHADALNKVTTAAGWAYEAVDHNHNGRFASAFGRWDMIYNYAFPTYEG